MLLKATVAMFIHCFRRKSGEGGDRCTAVIVTPPHVLELFGLPDGHVLAGLGF